MKTRKKAKKFLSVMLAVIITMGVLAIAPITADSVETAGESIGSDDNNDTYTSGDFKYKLVDYCDEEYDFTKAMITDYTGSAKDLTIPSEIDGYKVTSIGGSAFSLCSSIESITIPDSVTSIGNGAFYWCTSLENIILPDSVASIGDNAFELCTNLKSITIPDCARIGSYAFYCCYDLENITIPNSVTSIGNYAFSGCISLTGMITIPNSVTIIDNYVFYGCSSLEGVTIPDSVTSIGKYTFGYDYNGVIEGFKIYGYADTAAEQYANDNGFEFIDLAQKVKAGDANGDGEINAKDRMTLTRYLAKWSGYEGIDKSAADVNNDGEVNAKDRMILTRHLAKWTGYETLPYKNV